MPILLLPRRIHHCPPVLCVWSAAAAAVAAVEVKWDFPLHLKIFFGISIRRDPDKSIQLCRVRRGGINGLPLLWLIESHEYRFSRDWELFFLPPPFIFISFSAFCLRFEIDWPQRERVGGEKVIYSVLCSDRIFIAPRFVVNGELFKFIPSPRSTSTVDGFGPVNRLLGCFSGRDNFSICAIISGRDGGNRRIWRFCLSQF